VNAELLTAQALKAQTAETAQTAQTAQTAETARVREKARTAERRGLPNGASCHTARTAQRREVPNGDNGADLRGRKLPDGANCRRAQPRNGATRCPIESGRACTRRLPLRSLAPRAVGPFASFDVGAVVAVWHLALLGSLRRWAVCAVWQSAPFGSSRLVAHRARRFSGLRRLCTAPFRAPARAVSAVCAVCATYAEWCVASSYRHGDRL